MFALFRVLGLGTLLNAVLEFLAKIFVKSKFFRLIFAVIMLEGAYLLLNNAIQYFINYLFERVGGLGLPSAMCWALNTMDFWNVLSFYASVLISFAFAKYFLRMSERFI